MLNLITCLKKYLSHICHTIRTHKQASIKLFHRATGGDFFWLFCLIVNSMLRPGFSEICFHFLVSLAFFTSILGGLAFSLAPLRSGGAGWEKKQWCFFPDACLFGAGGAWLSAPFVFVRQLLLLLLHYYYYYYYYYYYFYYYFYYYYYYYYYYYHCSP